MRAIPRVETATVPAAPPSKLSKKLIELHIATIHTILMMSFINSLPKGAAAKLRLRRKTATRMATMVCVINLGRAGKPRMSSIKPIKPKTAAGRSANVIKGKVVFCIIGVKNCAIRNGDDA